jgi:hypothetical protein
MTSIVNDYADIRARMKGELKAQPKCEPEYLEGLSQKADTIMIYGGGVPGAVPAAPAVKSHRCVNCHQEYQYGFPLRPSASPCPHCGAA